MSHVVKIELVIQSLSALKAACARLGLHFMQDQKTYAWWGTSMGDFPMPEGFTETDLGRCEHAISQTGNASFNNHGGSNYEIGVVRRRDGKPGYVLLWDFIDHNLTEKVGGQTADKLRQAYALEAAKIQARQSGFQVREQAGKNGAVQLVLTR